MGMTIEFNQWRFQVVHNFIPWSLDSAANMHQNLSKIKFSFFFLLLTFIFLARKFVNLSYKKIALV